MTIRRFPFLALSLVLCVDGNDIYFGPAIAEASALYELAEGAFVWLTRKAASLPPGRSVAKHRRVVPFTVPLKNARSTLSWSIPSSTSSRQSFLRSARESSAR